MPKNKARKNHNLREKNFILSKKKNHWLKYKTKQEEKEKLKILLSIEFSKKIYMNETNEEDDVDIMTDSDIKSLGSNTYENIFIDEQ